MGEALVFEALELALDVRVLPSQGLEHAQQASLLQPRERVGVDLDPVWDLDADGVVGESDLATLLRSGVDCL